MALIERPVLKTALFTLPLVVATACNPTMDKLIASEKAALAPVRAKFLAAGEAVRALPKADPAAPCTIPPDLSVGNTVELAFIDSLSGIDFEKAEGDVFSTKLDPHKSDLTMALAWTSDKRPPERRPPFPYSLIPERRASDASIAVINHAKSVKYFIFTRVQERRDDEGVVIGEAHLTELASAKVLCSVSATGTADPNNKGQKVELVKVEKGSGRRLGTVRDWVEGDYLDLVSNSLASHLQAAAREKFKLATLEL